MENQTAYAKPVTLKNILRFVVPTIAMSVFMSFYTMVDGLFVSNLISTQALSAINLTAPVIQLVTAISTMLATGGSAVIMKKMGEQKKAEARQDFTFLILVNVIVGLVMCGAGYALTGKIFGAMDLSPKVSGYCVDYLSRYLLFTVPILLMNNFTLYMIASEKATLSLVCSVSGGVLNMVLDYVLIALCGLGITGAAIATGLGYSVTAVAGLVVFSRKAACSTSPGPSSGSGCCWPPPPTAARRWPPPWLPASSPWLSTPPCSTMLGRTGWPPSPSSCTCSCLPAPCIPATPTAWLPC